MARIDPFIRTLHESGADRLTLVDGRPVTLSDGEDERALSDVVPDRAQLRGLLTELLPEGDAGSPEGSHEFTYEAPTGSVRIRALLSSGTARIQVRPAGETTAADASGGGGGGPDGGGVNAKTATGTDREATPGEGGGAPEGSGEPAASAGSAATGPTSREAAGEPAAGEPTASAESAAAESTAGEAPAGEPAESAAGSTSGETAGEPAAGEPAADGDAPAIERLFRKMVDEGCSDLHVTAENPPIFRKDGEMIRIGEEPTLTAEQTREMLLEITPERNRREFRETNDTDFAYEVPGVARFRCNLFLDRKGMGGVFRQIPAEIMTAEDLGLPDAILDLCDLKKGLVVVTGPTGSGKSTTLAAMVDHLNRHRKAHVITIEDPIEFVHENKKCLINQRQVGEHTEGFKVALRAALREDPDIVLVGEMRDLETVEIALETAETGHLVFGTLHTNTAASTVDRVIDQFPSSQQNQIRTMLAESLKGVVAQTLCRRKGGGRVAAMEVLIVTNAVSNLIREGKTFQIPSLMQTGSSKGMVTLNDALLSRVQEEIVSPEEAYRNAVDKNEFQQVLERQGYTLED